EHGREDGAHDGRGRHDTAVTGRQPPVPEQPEAETSTNYDVVGKTIQKLRADMEAGVTTSAQITRAYLDRIEVYDTGQFGFHSYELVADDAMKQARAADRARKSGAHGPLLGIPIAVKNLYDTFDMPTTNATLAFRGSRPARAALQVALL